MIRSLGCLGKALGSSDSRVTRTGGSGCIELIFIFSTKRFRIQNYGDGD